MKRYVSILFFVTTGLLPAGMILRILHRPAGNLLFNLGLAGILVYFSARTIKDLILKRNGIFNITLQVVLVIMSVILFSKYRYHFFGDYPGLLIIPLFIVMSLVYLIKGKDRYRQLTIASVAYLLLTIPLIGIDIPLAPRQYLPLEWYDRFNVKSSVAITLPYRFKYYETEQLYRKAFELNESRQYYEAVRIYEEACKLEPENPRLLFDLSGIYAHINQLEKAVCLLDTAIWIDSTFAGFYNNRGLIYFKLDLNDKAYNDYKTAIRIDSSQSTYHANLALLYYYQRLYDKSCESLEKAEKLGLDIKNYKELARIKKRFCKK